MCSVSKIQLNRICAKRYERISMHFDNQISELFVHHREAFQKERVLVAAFTSKPFASPQRGNKKPDSIYLTKLRVDDAIRGCLIEINHQLGAYYS